MSETASLRYITRLLFSYSWLTVRSDFQILHNVFYYPILTTVSSLIEAFLCSWQSSIVNEVSHYKILQTVPNIEKPSES